MNRYRLHLINDKDINFLEQYPSVLEESKNSAAFCLVDFNGNIYYNQQIPIYTTQDCLYPGNTLSKQIAQIIEANIFFKIYCDKYNIEYQSCTPFELISKDFTNSSIIHTPNLPILSLQKECPNFCCTKPMLEAIYKQATDFATTSITMSSLEDTILKNIYHMNQIMEQDNEIDQDLE